MYMYMYMYVYICQNTFLALSDAAECIISWLPLFPYLKLAFHPTGMPLLVDRCGERALQLRPRPPFPICPARSPSATTTPPPARRASSRWTVPQCASLRHTSQEARTRTSAVVQSITCRQAAFGPKPAAASTSTQTQMAPRGRSRSPFAALVRPLLITEGKTKYGPG